MSLYKTELIFKVEMKFFLETIGVRCICKIAIIIKLTGLTKLMRAFDFNNGPVKIVQIHRKRQTMEYWTEKKKR